MIVPDLLRRAAAEAPDRVAAAVDGGGEMTYAEWEARANALARGLVARGVEPGDRVALCYDNAAWLEYAVAYFAVLQAGGVAVPVSPRWSAREVSHVIEHSGARSALAQPEHAARVPGAEPDLAAIAAGHEASPFQVLRTEDDLADVIYTSGTTGLPKGVASPHGNVAYEHVAGGGLFAGQTFVHAVPATTFAGTFAMLVVPCASRMTNVVLPRFDPERFCAVLAQRRAALTYIVPAMARLIVDSGAADRHDMSSVRVVRFGTAPMPAETLARLAKAFPNATLLNVYGLTEGGPFGTMMAYDPARPTSAGRIGASLLRIVDGDGRDVPQGGTGEIWMGRPAGARGRSYYRDPEATARTFRGDWVATGDIGRIDADGYLYVVDRAKDLLIRGGFNVSTVSVEDVLHEHPAVVEAAVFGVPHDVLGEDVAAAVVLRAPATADELRAHCAARLADYAIPRAIHVVDELPRNQLGKVLKRELRERHG